MTQRELIAAGMSPENARVEAARRFGSIEAVNAECQVLGRSRDRRVRRAEAHLELVHDLRFVLRQLARSKAFTAVVVITLALGMGATATVFSALYAVVLHPLPYEHAERIVSLAVTEKGVSQSPTGVEFAALRKDTHAFDGVAGAVLGTGVTIDDGETPELVQAGRVTASYFKVFSVKTEKCRTFTADEDTPGHANVVVLSHHAWTSRYASDSAIVSKTIHLNGEPFSVVGIMPATLCSSSFRARCCLYC